MNILGKRYDTGQAWELELAAGKVKSSRPAAHASGDLPWLAPGLVDLQVNGYHGQEFSDGTLGVDAACDIVRLHGRFGVTSLCPTITTNSDAAIAHAARTLAAASEQPGMHRRIAGIHVEGPYIAREDGPRGAHPLVHCRPPDWEEFQRWQDAASGLICILTMSPEYDKSAEFIAKVASSGVVVSIGHTAANSEQIRAAVDAGARWSTHLGNGAHGTIRRHPNYIWDQLAEDRLMAGLIVDGHHLPPAVVKAMIRAKTPERCVLVSDESGLAGLPPGKYETDLCELEILNDGRLVIAGQRQLLAGASRPLGAGIAGAMEMAGVSLSQAVRMATLQPSELIGYTPGGFAAGDPADFVLFRLSEVADFSQRLLVETTVIAGEVDYSHDDTA